MRDSERERIFGEWLAGHKGILFNVKINRIKSALVGKRAEQEES